MSHMILSYDFGTSALKTSLFSETGHLLASYTHSYEIYYSNGTWAEENPIDWWFAAKHTTARILEDYRSSDIAVISLSGHMSGALFLDRHMEVVRPHILWSDCRAWEEANYLKSTLDLPYHIKKSGKAPGASRMLEKIMWVQKNEPEAYEKTCKIIQAKDFIAYMLTGEIYTDYTDASATYLFDREKKVFSDELLAIADISPSLMPEAVPSITRIGSVTKEASEYTGLLKGTPVVIGAGDVAASTVGARCVSKNQLHFSIGSSAWCAMTTEQPHPDYSKAYSILHAVDGLYINDCTLTTAGIAYKWLKNQLWHETETIAAQSTLSAYDIMNQAAENVPAGANGVMFLPYLLGDQSLYNNPNATGAFLGLCAESTRADMTKAVLEGVCHYLCAAADIYTQGAPLETSPLLIGGAAKGNIWGQIISDMLGYPCMIPEYPEETSSIGAAIIGGIGAGIFPDFSAASDFVKTRAQIIPDTNNHIKYRKLQKVFLEVYYGLEPYYTRLCG